jgi:glycosyltransferase involved in cell wall biosynthesis
VTWIRTRHLCIVTETYAPDVNGVAHTLRHLVEGLEARGHTVSLVRPRPRAATAQGAMAGPRATSGEILVRGLPLPRYPGLQFGLPAGAVLSAAWAARRPDGVYVATEGPLGWSAASAARHMRIPVASGFHTNLDRYVGHYGGGWLGRTVARYLRRFHNRTDRTIVATAELRDALDARGFRNVDVLGRGVDTALFDPRRRCPTLRRAWGAGDEDLIALYVGRLAPEKNVPLAIDAYRAMRRARPRMRLVVVGDGPLGAGLRAAHPDVVFCGVQRGERLAAHYASADVFLFPSETETFGNVVLEALASGLPVVAFDYAAARAHIAHGDTGMLAPYRDAWAFIRGAEALAQPPRALDAMGRHARASVLPCEWARVVERFERLLVPARVEGAVMESTLSFEGGDRS